MKSITHYQYPMLLLLFGLHLLVSSVFAADKALDVSQIGKSPISLTDYFAVLEDPSLALTLADVQKTEVAAQFKTESPKAEALGFGYTRSAYWLRLSLRNTADQPVERMLEIAYARISSIQFHQPIVGGSYQSLMTGNTLPFATRPYDNRFFVFPVALPAHAEQVYYLRLQSTPAIVVPARLWEPKAFYNYERDDYLGQAWYFGMATAMILFNLLLFIALRDSLYLLYISFVICTTITVAAGNGLVKEFLWPDSPLWSEILTTSGFSLSVATIMLFMRRMLDTGTIIPKLDNLLKIYVGIILMTPIGFVISYPTFIKPVIQLQLASGFLLMGTGLYCAFKRQRSAYFFVVAFALLIVGAFVNSLRGFGLLPSNFFTANGVQIGSAFEMILLALALADRINTVRMENAAVRSRIQAEHATAEALRLSQQRYRDVINNVGEGMIVMQDEQVIFANECATRMLGVSKETLQQDGLTGRLLPEYRDLFRHRLRDRLAGKELPKQYEMQVQLVDGATRWLEAGDATLPVVDTHRVLVFFSDLTERKKAEEETRTALEQQRELVQLRSRFVDMCSHEFRNPLSIILTTQEFLQERGDQLADQKKTSLLQTIGIAARDMLKMLDQVLLLSKADAQMLAFRPQKMDLRDLCQVLVEEARLNQPKTRCELRIDFAPDLAVGTYDAQLLRHILGNLLSNAIKYSPLSGEITFRVFRDQSEIVMEVADQGIGIPESDLPHLFTSFHRARNVGGIEGTGLGLSIVKNAVERHGGTIQVTSQVGQGSCFTVRLPLQD